MTGETAVENAVRAGKAHLVVISGDASGNTTKKFTDKCAYYHVPLRVYATKAELGACTGAEARSCLAVTDRQFADALSKRMEQEA